MDLEPQDQPVKVYNFEVADWHNYFVGMWMMLVHNSGECGKEALSEIEKLHLEDIGKVVEKGLLFGKSAKGHLIKHADVLGFVEIRQQLQKMLPQLESAANNLFSKMKLERVGKWSEFENAKFYIGEGKMMITQQDGTFITTINKTSNAWFQKATQIK